jgi:tetratricopeptide (TPR) repeat protein
MLGKRSVRAQAFALSLVLGALLACKEKNNAPPPTPVPTASPSAATGPCAAGTSEDPAQGEFRPAQSAFNDKDYKTAIKLLDTMMTKYPNSATVRVWRGDAALFDKDVAEKKAADNAIPFYDEALKIHDRGCKLPEYEQYYLRMGYTYAYLRKRKPDEAIEHLQIAKKTWDNSAEIYYQLARAYCLKNDLDACADNFEKTLETAKALKRPKFLRSHHSLDDWVRRSRTQSEFPALRKDPRYAKVIAKMTAEE